jgi:hypothetical protein
MKSGLLGTLVQTVKDAKEQIAHFGEAAIDLASDNEVWKDVPLVEHAVKLLHIRDTYNTNKIKRNYAAFVSAVGKTNPSETQTLLGKLTQDDPLTEDTAETIFDVIVTAQKPVKAGVLGNLTLALARGKVDLDEYHTLALMLQSCSIAALLALPAFLQANNSSLHKRHPGPVENEALLFSLGVGTRHGNMFRIDERGKRLAEFGFGLTVVD